MNTIDVKKFGWAQKLLVLVFAGFNVWIAINLFMSYSEREELKWAYAVLGGSWDLFMLVNIVLLKTAIKTKQVKSIISYSAVYTVLVCIGIIGSIGFNIANVNNQSKGVASAQVASNELEGKLNTLKAQKATIEANVTRFGSALNTIPADNIRRIKEVTDQQNAEMAKITVIQNQIDTLVEQMKATPVSTDIAAQDIFDSVGGAIGVEGNTVKNMVFILIALMIQLALFVNCPVLNTGIKLNGINRRKMDAFIEALFSVNGVRLNNNEAIMERTNLDEKDVKEIREYLMSLKYNGEPILSNKGKGKGTQSPLTKDNFKTIVRILMNSSENA